MDVDQILGAMNAGEVDYLLIGGMNFLLRHEPPYRRTQRVASLEQLLKGSGNRESQ